jgi:hypothetical protein
MALMQEQDIGKMSKAKMEKVIPRLVTAVQTSYFNLGGLIRRVRDEGLFADWEGVEYASYDEWCEEILKFKMRKAQHLVRIYDAVVDLAPGDKLMQRLLDLGWTKVDQILRLARTKEELSEWTGIAEECSQRELAGKVRFELAQQGTGNEDDNILKAADPSVLKRFRLTADQSEHVEKTLEIIKRRFPSATDGEALSMMALAYAAKNVADDEGGLLVELSYLIDGLEKAYGVKLKVAKDGAGKAAATKRKKKTKKKKSA